MLSQLANEGAAAHSTPRNQSAPPLFPKAGLVRSGFSGGEHGSNDRKRGLAPDCKSNASLGSEFRSASLRERWRARVIFEHQAINQIFGNLDAQRVVRSGRGVRHQINLCAAQKQRANVGEYDFVLRKVQLITSTHSDGRS